MEAALQVLQKKNITCQYVKCFQHSKVLHELNDYLTWGKGHLVYIDMYVGLDIMDI